MHTERQLADSLQQTLFHLMSNAIKVENLGKKYIIQHQQQSRYRYNSLGESLTCGLGNLPNTFQSHAKTQNSEEFWALKDINFEIKHGDRIGVIGRNSTCKSTRLKPLNRIHAPTIGKITTKGRVASLLEVGNAQFQKTNLKKREKPCN